MCLFINTWLSLQKSKRNLTFIEGIKKKEETENWVWSVSKCKNWDYPKANPYIRVEYGRLSLGALELDELNSRPPSPHQTGDLKIATTLDRWTRKDIHASKQKKPIKKSLCILTGSRLGWSAVGEKHSPPEIFNLWTWPSQVWNSITHWSKKL